MTEVNLTGSLTNHMKMTGIHTHMKYFHSAFQSQTQKGRGLKTSSWALPTTGAESTAHSPWVCFMNSQNWKCP